MKKTIEQVIVNDVDEANFTDKSTGEVKKYWRCTVSNSDGAIFIINEFQQEPKVKDIYNLYLTKDSKLKPVIKYEKA